MSLLILVLRPAITQWPSVPRADQSPRLASGARSRARHSTRSVPAPGPRACGSRCVIFQLEDDHSRLAGASHVADSEDAGELADPVGVPLAAWSRPQARIFRGANEAHQVPRPFPSCQSWTEHWPSLLLPVDRTVPSVRRPRLCSAPAATATMSRQDDTLHWPRPLSPTAQTPPQESTPRACRLPAATERTFRRWVASARPLPGSPVASTRPLWVTPTV